MNTEKLDNYIKVLDKVKDKYEGYWLNVINKVSSILEYMRDNEEFINSIEECTHTLAKYLRFLESMFAEYLTGKELLDIQSLRKNAENLNKLYNKYTIKLTLSSGANYKLLKNLLQNNCGYSYEDEYFVFDNVDYVKETLKDLNEYIMLHYDLPNYYLIIRRQLWKVAKFLENNDRRPGVVNGVWWYTGEYIGEK